MDKHLKRVIDIISFRTLLIAVIILTGFLQFLLMVGNVRGITYDIEPFQLAPETIRSAKTVEDTVKTEQERNEAEDSVEPVYVFNEETAEHRAALVMTIFDIVLDVRDNFETERNSETEKVAIEEQIQVLKGKLKEITESQSQLTLSNNHLQALLTTSEESLTSSAKSLSTLVKTTLSDPIQKENVTDIRNELESKIRQQHIVEESFLTVLILIGRAAVIETEVLDEKKTEELKQQARDEVEPTRILQGQIIVQEGELINREVYRQLELLGLLKNNTSTKPVLGLMLLIVLQMSFLYILFEREKMAISQKRKAVLVTCIVYALSIVVMKLMSLVTDEFDVSVAFLFPSALGTMLVSLLASERAALLVTILTATSSGVVFHEGYSAVLQMDIALYILFGGLSSLFFIRKIETNAHLVYAVGVVSLANLLFIACYLLMSQSNYEILELAFYAISGIVSALLSGALTMGLLPFFESALGLLSTMKLIELSNPNHPLLRKILIETPGTYHHSVMVANLAEAACEAIGADGLLARVGCYYHDVGKTRRPAFFVENQVSGINPHDSLPPERSAEIIIAHTTDGAELLRKHKMPKEIIDIALQHHGTSTLKYFLFKAKEEGKEVDEEIYRYPGPKPQTKEAAIVSIADSVEAASRSIKQPTLEKIRDLVHSIIEGRIKENQFDDCDISIKELKIIEEVLCETLNGSFHSRIEYPKEG